MKKKLFVYALFAAMISGGAYAQQTDDQEDPEENGGSSASCTVTSTCFGFLGQGIEGSVSCTGSTCERGFEYVICNGKRTNC